MGCAGASEVSVSKETAEAKPKITARLVEYFKDTRGEIRKVSWPTRAQLINLTLIVLAVTTAMALLLGAMDLMFAQLVSLLVS